MSRETEHKQERSREREGDTESEAGSRLQAGSTDSNAGLQPMTCKSMTWAEVGRLTDWATQAPLLIKFLINLGEIEVSQKQHGPVWVTEEG